MMNNLSNSDKNKQHLEIGELGNNLINKKFGVKYKTRVIIFFRFRNDIIMLDQFLFILSSLVFCSDT